MIDQSYKPRWKVGRLYWSLFHGRMVKVHGSHYAGGYPHDGAAMEYVLWCDGRKFSHHGEEGLRPITFGEFLLYRDPETRGLKIGHNRAWPLLFANAVALAGLIANGVPTDFWTGLVLAVCAGVPLLTILGTWKNHTGAWH